MHNSSAGNPIVIASDPELRLHDGPQDYETRPYLLAFISGIPQPNVSAGITWYFNGQPTLPSEIMLNTNKKDEVILPRDIQMEIAGTYTCQVSTSAGTSSVDFLVSIIGELY